MKLHIAIVEDEKAASEYLITLIQKWATESGNPVQVTECSHAEEFLFKYPKTECFNLIFLDINMGKMNGMELATQIRSRDKRVQLVFLTGVADYVFEGYKIGALRYLLKPVQEADLVQVLADCTATLEQAKNDYFPLDYLGEKLRLSFSDIIYVQVNGHYVQMKVLSVKSSVKSMKPGEKAETSENIEMFEWKGSLAKTKELLYGKEFIPVNRSTIVNLSYVTKLTRESCFLETGEQLEISRNEYPKVNQAFIDFYNLTYV